MNLIKLLIMQFKKRKNIPDKSVDLSVKDCLVGIVKSENQLNINLKEKFYHIPANFIYEIELPIKYIALYMSAKTFGKERAGIFYCGCVASYRVVPRYEIMSIPKQSTEPYFVFRVDGWERLENPIKPLETAQVVTMTNFELLKRSEYIPELYVNSWEEFRLFGFLKEVCICGAENLRYNFYGTKIGASADTIEIIYPNGERRKYDRFSYMNKPLALFRNIMIHTNRA